jgi:hypothetical protein
VTSTTARNLSDGWEHLPPYPPTRSPLHTRICRQLEFHQSVTVNPYAEFGKVTTKHNTKGDEFENVLVVLGKAGIDTTSTNCFSGWPIQAASVTTSCELSREIEIYSMFVVHVR